MEITRNVILDLLPLYAAGEVSADTKALIEHYLETDPELANVAQRLNSLEKPEEISMPPNEHTSWRIYRNARLRIIFYTLLLAGAISVLLIAILIFFLVPS